MGKPLASAQKTLLFCATAGFLTLNGCSNFWNPPPNPTSTTTTLSSSNSSPAVGESVTLTAIVSLSAATGKVTFYSGSTSLGSATLSSGTATFPLSLSATGTISLTAVYSGDSNYASSTSSAERITVTGSAVSTATLIASPTDPALGQNVTLTVTVSPSAATGTVTFYSSSTSLGSGTLSSGITTQVAAFWISGNQSITAVYSGDSTYAATSSATTVDVGPPGSTQPYVSLSGSTNVANVGDLVTLTAIVSAPGATGQLTFYDGTTELEMLPLSSSAVPFSWAFMPGVHLLTVQYSGDPTYAAATSGVFVLTVN